jgi:membrane protease YdiL (CAAX protease family)
MSHLGSDFSGGLLRRLYWPDNPGGLAYGLAVAAILLLLHYALQAGLSYLVLSSSVGAGITSTREIVKVGLIVILPASLVIAVAACRLAGQRGGTVRRVLNLRRPELSALGWLALVAGFMLVMYAAIIILVLILGIDLADYTPGADGQSPSSGSAGLVKEAVFDLANEPLLFLAVLPSIAIGAPLAEELIFRGQLFSALAGTRLGVAGATVLTSALWALLHVTEPWLSIGLIFVMGLVLGFLMYRFGSLWVAMVCHGAWNGIYALMIFGGAGGGT